MMPFIPLIDSHQPTQEKRNKILFYHIQFQGEEVTFSISGFQDLKTIIKLRNGNSVSLRTLIMNISVSTGMTCPQLFQHVEPNITVTMVIFQKQDSALVYARQKNLETEIHQVIAEDEEYNVFLNEEDGSREQGEQNKDGRILATQQTDRSSLEYTKKIECVIPSPPKKRGGGIPPSPSNIIHPIHSPTNLVPTIPTPATQWNTQNTTTSSLDAKFVDIKLQFSKQREHNANFNHRISAFENTTNTIDGKIDHLLNFYEDQLIPPTKLQRIKVTTLICHHALSAMSNIRIPLDIPSLMTSNTQTTSIDLSIDSQPPLQHPSLINESSVVPIGESNCEMLLPKPKAFEAQQISFVSNNQKKKNINLHCFKNSMFSTLGKCTKSFSPHPIQIPNIKLSPIFSQNSILHEDMLPVRRSNHPFATDLSTADILAIQQLYW